MAGPVDGLVVVDLSWGMPGAVTSMLLADYGATVVKVERPGGGPDRESPAAGGVGAGQALDHPRSHDSAAGRSRLDALLGAADVLIESFPPGRAAPLGLGVDAVRRAHPTLVHCSITGYGQDGPWTRPPGLRLPGRRQARA